METNNTGAVVSPVTIDLGKKTRKRIKSLKKGRGKLSSEVDMTVDQVRSRMGSQGENTQLVPVVMIYRKKDKKKKKYKKQMKKIFPLM